MVVTRSGSEAKLEKNLRRRRANIFLAFFFVAATLLTMWSEANNFLFFLDELGVLFSSIIILIVLVAAWNKKSPRDILNQNNIVLILFVIALIFKIYGFIIEAASPPGFGDEEPVLIALIVAIANRFI